MSDLFPAARYLVPFHPKEEPHFFADVLIIGSGLAGLRAAMAVDPSLSVLVVTKRGISESNSVQAQGGIAGVLSPQDTIEEHVADTLTAGGTLCDSEVVQRVVADGPEEIRRLIEWGAQFDTEGDEIDLTREGGHSHRRVAHALGDATGKEIMRAVEERVRSLENIDVWEHTFTLDLLTHDGECRGALVWNSRHGKTLIWAKQTIIASGGLGQIYRETTNPDVATGDGLAIAYRAGAELRDLEFVQFHPTVLYIAGSSRSLITEAIRGEGAYLVDRNGRRFMTDYDPRAELAPRDVVSSSIVKQMERSRHPNVYLDLSHLDGPWVRTRFPGIAETCAKFGLDIAKDRIPVRPGAHYAMGGITVDADGRTSVPGLWGAGEVTSSGLHGANRLASNSLLEALVYGSAAGLGASESALAIDDDYRALPLANPTLPPQDDPLDLWDIRNSLKSLMWRDAGVTRDADALSDAASHIQLWSSYVLRNQFDDPSGWELQNMLCLARLIVEAASRRNETRGCHVRTDHPELDSKQENRHITFLR
jgi:L-aspartate oxidase